MKNIYENVNWKILNLSFWVEMILSYLWPFKIVSSSQYQVGFPIPFISLDPARIGISPFMSMHFNPIGLFVNGIIVYWIIIFGRKVYRKIVPGEKVL